MWLPLARHIVGLLFVAPVPASARKCERYHFLPQNFQCLTSGYINRALLHSPVIEGLTKLLFHCGRWWWWWLVVSSCWSTLSSHRRIAKFSRLSGLSACAAVSRKGTARAARLVHTHVFAKLAAASARQKKLQQCRRFTWRFASKIFKILPSNHDCCWAFVSISSYTHYCVWTFMSTYRHLTPKKYDCHSAFSFMRQQAWETNKHSVGNAWNTKNITTASPAAVQKVAP